MSMFLDCAGKFIVHDILKIYCLFQTTSPARDRAELERQGDQDRLWPSWVRLDAVDIIDNDNDDDTDMIIVDLVTKEILSYLWMLGSAG